MLDGKKVSEERQKASGVEEVPRPQETTPNQGTEEGSPALHLLNEIRGRRMNASCDAESSDGTRIPKDYCKLCVVLLAVALGYKEALAFL